MRYPFIVATEIKRCIPIEEEVLHIKMDWYLNEFRYKAPEQRETWGQLAHFVNEIVKEEDPLKTDWKIKIVAILTNQSEGDVRRAEEAKRV